jgi:SAM-dependent methyltransferase
MSTLGTSFGTAAGDYDKGRPSYPAEAVTWMVGKQQRIVLDAGAGTGKLTAELIGLDHEVIALDPDEAMLSTLSQALPDVETIIGTAEDIDLPDEAVDAVVFGQSWHWVEVGAASAEVARILKPGGVLGLVWNIRDESVPWVARLTEVMHGSKAEGLLANGGPHVGSPFGPLEHKEVRWSRPMTADQLVAMARSRSYYIAGDTEYRARVEADLAQLIASLPDVADGGRIALPYVTHAFRTKVQTPAS